jgi:peptidoglycan/LPS O-acetylase OafA/YrhL
MGPALAAKKSSAYIPGLDGLRALAFLLVFVSHTSANTIGHLVPATFGVTVFFFLSGYLITTLLREEVRKTGTFSIKDFYIRRALRIFIPMYVAYASAAVLGVVFKTGAGTLKGLFTAVFYFYNYARMLGINHIELPSGMDVIWSLSVEEHFYLLFPLFYLFLVRRHISVRTQAKILIGLCVLGLCWRTFVAFHDFPVGWTYYATDCRFDSILWGSLLAVWNNPHVDAPDPILKRYSGWLAAGAFLLIIASMGLSVLIHSGNYRESLRYTLQGICLYFIFYFAVASSHHWSVHWLENKALRYIGWLSYTLYLIHRPIQDAITPYLPNKDWIVSPVCFVLAFTFAYIVRQTIELPLQRLRARFRHTEIPISASIPAEGI